MSTVSLRDQRFEALFQRWNLKWEFIPELSLAEQLRVIDESQVRDLDHVAIPESVHEYELQMKGGASFPPVVVMKPDILIDGNTRITAARNLGRTTFPAYLVDVDGIDFAKMLAATLNQLGGRRLTPAEANRAALAMMDLGWTDDAVGRELGYSAESVRRWRREAEFTDRVEQLGLVEQASRLSKRQRQDIAKITHSEPFTEVVKLIADVKPDPRELKELIETVEKAASDSAAVQTIRDARREWTPVGPEPQRVYRNRAAQQLRMHLGGITSALANPTAVYDPQGGEKDIERIRAAIEGLQAVLRMYEERATS
jgi:ParB-like chromosome segregation protein Spo0J